VRTNPALQISKNIVKTRNNLEPKMLNSCSQIKRVSSCILRTFLRYCKTTSQEPEDDKKKEKERGRTYLFKSFQDKSYLEKR